MLFKKFNPKEDISSQTNMKNSHVKQLRQKLQQQYDLRPAELDLIVPASKKNTVIVCKCNMLNVSLLLVRREDDSNDDDTTAKSLSLQEDEFLFWNSFDGDWIPTLRLLHRFPWMLKQVQIDKGAIRHIVNGAPIMCVGLTSKGGRLPGGGDGDDEKSNWPVGTIVAVMAEGKQHACAIGQLSKSIEEIRSVNKDTGIETLHHIGDELFNNPVLK
ncbi:hypothetical protein MP228_006155 [Amoeboaphelidium protococcarum]|nr:hypothetical protein MP228_006155 [Amoeboaphelidium protococcarum]